MIRTALSFFLLYDKAVEDKPSSIVLDNYAVPRKPLLHEVILNFTDIAFDVCLHRGAITSKAKLNDVAHCTEETVTLNCFCLTRSYAVF